MFSARDQLILSFDMHYHTHTKGTNSLATSIMQMNEKCILYPQMKFLLNYSYTNFQEVKFFGNELF